MGLLILNATVLAFLLTAVATAISGLVVKMVGWRAGACSSSSARQAWKLLREPLMPVWYRLAFAALTLALSWLISRKSGSFQLSSPTARAIGIAVVSAIVLVPIMDTQIRERDRSKVETFAAEVLRPVDGWLKFIVEEGLEQVLIAWGDVGVSHSTESVALRAWAQSAACREGYSSVFELLDADGQEEGRFAIGGQTGVAQQVSYSVPLDTQGILRVKSIGDGVSAVRVYSGSAPVFGPSGGMRGHARVTVAAGEQQLFRGDNPRCSAARPVRPSNPSTGPSPSRSTGTACF